VGAWDVRRALVPKIHVDHSTYEIPPNNDTELRKSIQVITDTETTYLWVCARFKPHLILFEKTFFMLSIFN